MSSKNAFPLRVISLISEYSKPMTRPDWRQSKPIITTYKLYCIFRRRERKGPIKLKYFRILENIENTEWYYTFTTIKNSGLKIYFRKYLSKYGVEHDPNINVFDIDGIEVALKKYYAMDPFSC
jgi:hypothetical protein